MQNLRSLLSSSRSYLVLIGMLLLGTSAAIVWQPPIVDSTLHGDGTHEDPIGVDTTAIASVHYVDSVAAPYKVYTAVLTQSGTDDPVATVFKNTLGFNITWQYLSPGKYAGNAAEWYDYTADQVFTLCNNPFTTPTAGSVSFFFHADEDRINLVVNKENALTGIMAASDEVIDPDFTRFSVEIRIYP